VEFNYLCIPYPNTLHSSSLNPFYSFPFHFQFQFSSTVQNNSSILNQQLHKYILVNTTHIPIQSQSSFLRFLSLHSSSTLHQILLNSFSSLYAHRSCTLCLSLSLLLIQTNTFSSTQSLSPLQPL